MRLHRMHARWIIGSRADLLRMMGGVWLGYALLALYAATRFDLTLAWFGWLAILNGPHLFATYARTYLSPAERRSRGALLASSLALFAIGPALLVLGVLTGARAPFFLFFLLVSLWAYWHLLRQHLGVLRLYQRRNDDAERSDLRIDSLLLHVGLLAPFVSLLATHPEVRANLGLAAPHPGDAGHLLRAAALTLLGVTLLLFAGRQVLRARRGAALNVPKLLFLAALLPYYAAVCLLLVWLRAPLFAIGPFLVVPHDLQYHALVGFYLRNQRAQPRPEPADLGTRLVASIPASLLCMAALGALIALLSCGVDRSLACEPLFAALPFALPGGFGARELFAAGFYGFFVHHYFLDQRIWHVSREPAVARGLGLETATSR